MVYFFCLRQVFPDQPQIGQLTGHYSKNLVPCSNIVNQLCQRISNMWFQSPAEKIAFATHRILVLPWQQKRLASLATSPPLAVMWVFTASTKSTDRGLEPRPREACSSILSGCVDSCRLKALIFYYR